MYFAIVIDHSYSPEMITEQTKAPSELAITASLSVTAKAYVGTLSMWHEELVVTKEGVEFTQALADTGVD